MMSTVKVRNPGIRSYCRCLL